MRYARQTSDVQCAQRVASIGISDRQRGHFFVVGSAGGASSFFFAAFMALTTMKMARATMMKSSTVLMNVP